MGVSRAFWIDRITLAAGVKTPIFAPRICRGVSIGNGTLEDLRVYSHDGEADDDAHYLVVATGYERPIGIGTDAFIRDGQPACWLRSAAGGLVVLIWL